MLRLIAAPESGGVNRKPRAERACHPAVGQVGSPRNRESDSGIESRHKPDRGQGYGPPCASPAYRGAKARACEIFREAYGGGKDKNTARPRGRASRRRPKGEGKGDF